MRSFDSVVERIRGWLKGRPQPPYLVDINPTDLCNLRCGSCWQRNPRFRKLDNSYQLPDSTILSVVDQCIEMGAKSFEITGGGEPFMRKNLVMEVARKIKGGAYKRNCNCNCEGSITTNGTLLTKKDILTLINMGWDSLTFSLDGPTPSINDYLRGKGTFSRIINAIKVIKDQKERNPELSTEVKTNTVISRINAPHLKEMVRLGHELGIGYMSFDTLTVHSEEGKKLKVREDISANVEEAVKLAKELGLKTNIGHISTESLSKSNSMRHLMRKYGVVCYEPFYHFVVKVDGSANPCCVADLRKENVKEKSVRKIWYGNHFNAIRKRLLGGRFLEFCRICNAGQLSMNLKIREALNGERQ